ncbi:MAG: ATP-binding cassette domain-containing protein [Eubacterium sp.]|nr:ATP-binding cassette domain-containing protein [Eubacterium sp.]
MAQIEIKNLSFKYKTSDKETLKKVSLCVEKGQFIVVCGKSGCGKTTFLRCFKPQIRPAGNIDGMIYYTGENMEEMTDEDQAKKIGFVMQNPEHQIVTDKVWHELAFGLENFGEKSEHIRAKVAEIAEYFGITDWYYEDTDCLSGGQKQLLNLASIMVMGPEVLVLDEPTAQLDPIAAEKFLDILKKINEDFGITVIISEHRLNYVLQKADKMLILDMGQVEKYGDVREIVKKGLYMDIEPLMPVPSRIFGKSIGQGEVPISVAEGRRWLENQGKIQNKKAGKVIEGIETPKKKDRKTLDFQYSVVCKDIWFRYEKNGRDIVQGLNLTVKRGEIFAILGGNGAGKTTTLLLLSKILKAYRGKLKIDGKTALLPQNVQILFERETVSEELGHISDKLIKEMKLEGLMRMHPYDLSGGEQQKAALAKILLKDPDILLLDEPTKGMDNIFKEELGRLLKSLAARGKTIIIVSHDLDFCGEFVDRCGLFANGSLISISDVREFFVNNRFYTTTVAKLAREIVKNAYKMEDIIC